MFVYILWVLHWGGFIQTDSCIFYIVHTVFSTQKHLHCFTSHPLWSRTEKMASPLRVLTENQMNTAADVRGSSCCGCSNPNLLVPENSSVIGLGTVCKQFAALRPEVDHEQLEFLKKLLNHQRKSLFSVYVETGGESEAGKLVVTQAVVIAGKRELKRNGGNVYSFTFSCVLNYFCPLVSWGQCGQL